VLVTDDGDRLGRDSTVTDDDLADHYVSRFKRSSTRVEARVRVRSIVGEFFPPSPAVFALLRVLRIPGTSDDADLESCAFQRELLDPSFTDDESDTDTPESVMGRGAECDDGTAGSAFPVIAVRGWQRAPALRLSAMPVRIRDVVMQLRGIATLLWGRLRGRGERAALGPSDQLGCVLLALAGGFTSHVVLARARELMASLPNDAREYAATAGYAYVADAVHAVAPGGPGSDIDCLSLSLRSHINDFRPRAQRGRVAAEVCSSDVHMLGDITAEAMDALVMWRVVVPGDKKFGTPAGRMRATAKLVHVKERKLMLWALHGPSGGVAASACFTHAECLLRIWQRLPQGTRMQISKHASAGCRLVVGSDGMTTACECVYAAASRPAPQLRLLSEEHGGSSGRQDASLLPPVTSSGLTVMAAVAPSLAVVLPGPASATGPSPLEQSENREPARADVQLPRLLISERITEGPVGSPLVRCCSAVAAATSTASSRLLLCDYYHDAAWELGPRRRCSRPEVESAVEACEKCWPRRLYQWYCRDAGRCSSTDCQGRPH
jgi:hypothetical protein